MTDQLEPRGATDTTPTDDDDALEQGVIPDEDTDTDEEDDAQDPEGDDQG